jgi:CRISPR/Cas system CSM-associated protein Csm3 (group 7 of RAMP superfamily)
MSITTKDWTAQIDRMPGAASFRTYGTVTVANSGITPKLVLSARQDKSTDLRLDLLLEESSDMSMQILTDKFVEYKGMGNSNVTGVSIFHEGKLLHRIDEVLITH